MNGYVPTIGDLVAVSFDDHARNQDAIFPFVLYGRVSILTDAALTVDCWCHADHSVRDENTERYTVVRAAIRKIEKLTTMGAKG
jgi:hypothetical protein